MILQPVTHFYGALGLKPFYQLEKAYEKVFKKVKPKKKVYKPVIDQF